MQLVEILLPIADNTGVRLPRDLFDATRDELVARFGGVTMVSRSPGAGLWEDADGRVRADSIVVFEIMVDDLDAEWWRGYRRQLEARFGQDVIVVRASPCAVL
jgi:hypothetical protein